MKSCEGEGRRKSVAFIGLKRLYCYAFGCLAQPYDGVCMAFLRSLLRSAGKLVWSMCHSSVENVPLKLPGAEKQAWKECRTSM